MMFLCGLIIIGITIAVRSQLFICVCLWSVGCRSRHKFVVSIHWHLALCCRSQLSNCYRLFVCCWTKLITTFYIVTCSFLYELSTSVISTQNCCVCYLISDQSFFSIDASHATVIMTRHGPETIEE